jgi:hypothetical protein
MDQKIDSAQRCQHHVLPADHRSVRERPRHSTVAIGGCFPD